MGLKILSNAKIKKPVEPVDCSHQSEKYSNIMDGGKLATPVACGVTERFRIMEL